MLPASTLNTLSVTASVTITLLYIKFLNHSYTQKVEAVYISSCELISKLWSVTCHMRSHSVNCHPTQVNVPCFNSSQTGWYSITYPRGMVGWVVLQTKLLRYSKALVLMAGCNWNLLCRKVGQRNAASRRRRWATNEELRKMLQRQWQNDIRHVRSRSHICWLTFHKYEVFIPCSDFSCCFYSMHQSFVAVIWVSQKQRPPDCKMYCDNKSHEIF